MWGLEHMAFAYLVIRPFYAIKGRKVGPELLIMIFAFANLPDALHVGAFRFLLHNSIGLLIFAIIWLAFFIHYGTIKRKHLPVISLAVVTHVIGDLLFSNFYLLYPLSDAGYNHFGWMSFEHVLSGSIIMLAFGLCFYLSGDYSRTRKYLHREEKKFLAIIRFKEIWNQKKFVYYVYSGLRAFLVVQFFLLIYFSRSLLGSGVWYAWLFLIASGLVLVLLVTLSFKPKKGLGFRV